jgi:hypothetical protein
MTTKYIKNRKSKSKKTKKEKKAKKLFFGAFYLFIKKILKKIEI